MTKSAQIASARTWDLTTDPNAIGIGTSRRRPEAAAKIRGEFEFAPDLTEPGMLWGATLRSPHAHARIVRVDLNAAKAMAGVHAVLGGWDVPDNHYGAIVRDSPVLADEVATYVGEPIALVAADDPEIARRALEAIVVEYEVLDPLVDAMKALDDGHVYRHVEYTHGDPTVVGDVQVEGVYTTPRQDHSYLGLDGGIAKPDGRGGVIITGATQWVHSDRAQVAAALGLPPERVLVINSGIGGAFGGRFVLSWQIHGALLAIHTERPVKFLYSREEAFLARYHRHPTRIWVRHHATKDGTIVNLEAKVVVEDGPYVNTAAPGIGNACTLLQGPYNIPNAHIEGWAVGTNNGMCGSLRGFGVVEPMYASESNLDALARALGMDGAELRRLNAMKQGDTWTFDQVMEAPAPVRELIDASGQAPLPEPLPGDAPDIRLPGGIATPTRPRDIVRASATSSVAKNVCLSEGAPVNSTALVTLRNGEAVIECAAADVGQGFKTVAEQIVQTTLGISKVRITGSDTNMADGSTTDGQLQTMTSGGAVYKAAATVKERFLRFVAREYGHDEEKLDIRDDHVVLPDGTRLMSVSDAGMNLVFRATERFEQRTTTEIENRSSGLPIHVAFNFSATRCTVDVDRELGLVRVVQMDVAQDVGRTVNPAQANGQIAGGILMGVGIALMEEFPYVDGVPTRRTWDDYLVPTIIDAPEINVTFFENAEPGIPYGMRGIAELPHVQGPPAVLAALRAATGLPLPSIPATPERIVNVHDSPHPAGAPSGPKGATTRERGVSARTIPGDPMRAPVSVRESPWSP